MNGLNNCVGNGRAGGTTAASFLKRGDDRLDDVVSGAVRSTIGAAGKGHCGVGKKGCSVPEVVAKVG
jgi:hypothetical protein